MRGGRELKQICNRIEAKMKNYKLQLFNKNSDLGVQDTKEKLYQSKESIVLDEVIIRPKNGASRKNNVGLVQAHKNFMQFVPKQGDKIIIYYKNIKHAIFQDGHKELIVLIHIRLKKPIKLNGKNVEDIQF